MMLVNTKPQWWIVPTITGLWTMMLIISAHSNYISSKSELMKNMSIKNKRKLKIRQINRLRRWKVKEVFSLKKIAEQE